MRVLWQHCTCYSHKPRVEWRKILAPRVDQNPLTLHVTQLRLCHVVANSVTLPWLCHIAVTITLLWLCHTFHISETIPVAQICGRRIVVILANFQFSNIVWLSLRMRSRSQLAIRSARKMKKKVFLQCLWKKSFFGGLKGLCFFSGSKKNRVFLGT